MEIPEKKHVRVNSNIVKAKPVLKIEPSEPTAEKTVTKMEPILQKRVGEKKSKTNPLKVKKIKKKNALSPNPRLLNQTSPLEKRSLINDLTSVVNLRNIYAPNKELTESEILSKNIRLDQDGLKAFISNKLKLKKFENYVEGGKVPKQQNPSITVRFKVFIKFS